MSVGPTVSMIFISAGSMFLILMHFAALTAGS